MKKIAALLFLFVFTNASAFALDADEKQKIEFLISSIENLQDATFIRNGNEYDARKAAEHLRLKLKKAGNRVKTVEDFIVLCASKSSVSGKPYRIRFKNGRSIETAVFFREALHGIWPKEEQ